MWIDHVIYATADLDAAAARVESGLGLSAVAGGRHEGHGTHNRIVPLGGGYLELMAVADPNEAATSPIGRALQARLAYRGDGLWAWSIGVEDVDQVAERLGLPVTTVAREGLTARLVGVDEALPNPVLPFFIERDAGVADPGGEGDTGGITWVEVAGGDAGALEQRLGGADLAVRVVDGPIGVVALGIGERELRNPYSPPRRPYPSSPQMDRIRNFSIIAHIDHGKSTLADRILELTGSVDARSHVPQMLDSMELERERGITIKAQAVRVAYTAADGETYHLHLIDTPGHVDFSYEVSRSLAACEGALLVVDAAQGVEAQTVANAYAAIDAGLELIPVLNKVDLPGADPDGVAAQVADLLGGDPDEALRISAKTGEGVGEVLEAIVHRIPPPQGEPRQPPRALIFDSEFDQYRGVVAFVRMVDGKFAKGEPIVAMQAGTQAEIDDIGFFAPKMTPAPGMSAGEVGYVITGIKDVTKLRVGDTLTDREQRAAEALPGYREVRPMVFCGLFPIDTDRYEDLRDALDRLALNDAALSYEPETSDALGFGFRCGFLGLLHMDIVRERLEREYDLELLATTPNVRYEVRVHGGELVEVHSPTEMPDPSVIEEILEPYIRATIITPNEYVGAVMELCQKRRGTHVDLHYLSPERVQIRYDLPLADIVLDFFDQLKSRSRGYASLDYEPIGNRASDLVKLDVLLAGDRVDALSLIVHRAAANDRGRALVERLQDTIPRQLFDVPVQAAIGSNVIARETVKALRKDVTAKLYGGDVTRKRKLLEKQKKGKKRMKQVGAVEVPQEAFLAVLEMDGSN